MKKLIEIKPAELGTIQEILREFVPGMTVWAFGSRIEGNPRKFSDLDIVLISDKPVDALCMASLRDAFSESDLPFKVDIIEWFYTDEEFRNIIRENYFVLND
jgi:predicted nucleotidyltransferase